MTGMGIPPIRPVFKAHWHPGTPPALPAVVDRRAGAWDSSHSTTPLLRHPNGLPSEPEAGTYPHGIDDGSWSCSVRSGATSAPSLGNNTEAGGSAGRQEILALGNRIDGSSRARPYPVLARWYEIAGNPSLFVFGTQRNGKGISG